MKAGRCSTNSGRVRLAFVMVVGTATLILGATPEATLETPPIPEAGPLARPKSLQQVGAPADATPAAIPPDNPQTPEKIALGQRLFFGPPALTERAIGAGVAFLASLTDACH